MTLHEPRGWRLYRLGQLFDERKEKVSDKDFPPLSVTMNGIVPQLETAAKSDDGDNRKLVKTGDYVINSRSDRKGSGGVSDYDGSVSLISIVLKPKGVHPSFAHHLLRSRAFQEEFYRWGHGIVADLWTTRYADMKNIRLFLPDLPTQKAIADFLDRETARIDQLIEKKQRFLSIADEHWSATLNHIIFPQSPDWEHLPREWRKVRLKYLTDPKRPIMYGIVLPGPNMEDGPMIVKGGDVKPGRLHPARLCRTTVEIESAYARSRLKSGDLVISIRGGIGDVEIVPPEIHGANLTQDAARIAPRDGVDHEWLRFALLSSAVFHPLEARSLGAAVRGINIFDLKRVFVPTPPEDLQRKIAGRLKQQEAKRSQLRSKVELHTNRLREFRSALITAAVTGQIDVATWGRRGEADRRLDEIQKDMTAGLSVATAPA
ncbi:restriction endonuclease subunit S [Aquibaculum arenosum]|uniref:Restriction endonuclease subunit S n=1 Tax=Aquibaculum arenosum TaxID=3032591 RepID=A0ABT5YMM8_9PROT|nr:restriction endonuclease subunit S [Fodinicurvata sp. CAU 1616]MDF2096025.1 restriction endonuclease subunit S [Fodinicurvata sp. CAU 1616]